MKFLFCTKHTWLLVGLLLSEGKPNFGDKLGNVVDNERSKNVNGDFTLNSNDMINGSDVIDILGRIETISSRILTKTKRRRQRILSDQEANVTETPEFQLIFLRQDNQEPAKTAVCEDITPDAEGVVPSERESEQLVFSIGTNIEEMIRQKMEDNETGTELTKLSDSLEAVINLVDTFQLNTSSEEAITSETSTKAQDIGEATTDEMVEDSLKQKTDNKGDVIATAMSAPEEDTTTHQTTVTSEPETTTPDTASTEPETEDSEQETSTSQISTTDGMTQTETTQETTTEFNQIDKNETLLDKTLSDLKAANLTKTDEQILLALLELEELRKQQNDKKEEINDKLVELETLLKLEMFEEQGDNDSAENIVTRVNKILSGQNVRGKKDRKGKTLSQGFIEEKGNKITTKINLFENLQKQLSSLLSERHKFLQDISHKVNRELGVIKQTMNFLQQLANFKLDQGELLLGKMDPILKILRSGSTSVFLMISRFFKAVESVLGMKDEFLRSFSSDPADIKEARLLERIKDLKLKVILPAKMRFLLNVHANSDQLGKMVEEIFACLGELVEAKVDVIESVGEFVEQKIEYLSGLTGPGLGIKTLLDAVRTGTLYKLANYGPVIQTGVPVLSSQELLEAVEELVSGGDPKIPIIGPVKPLLVNHRVLGMLAGRYRDKIVNLYLARKISEFIEHSNNNLVVRQGETILQSWLPPLHLGTPCTNQVILGRSLTTAVVNRRSRFSATTGPSIHSHAPPTLDMFGVARLHVNIHTEGHLSAKIGHRVFGKCLPKFSGDSPFSIRGNAVGTAFAKVIVKNARLETRQTVYNPILDNVFKDIAIGVQRPHLIFKFHIKLDGTVENFDISKLELDGCEFSVLGLKMFSHCNIVETIIKKQIHKATRNTFPLNDAMLLRELEYMIKMRIGDEIAIPLVLNDLGNLESVNRVIDKTGRLIDLNIRLFNRLVSFTQDMETVQGSL